MSGLFSGLGATIDSFTNQFVFSVSSNISIAIAPLVVSGFSIWIMIYGYAVMRNEVSDPINVFFKNLIKNAIIASIALGVGFYQDNIIGAIYGFQDGMVSTVSKSTSITSVNGGNVLAVIDNLSDKGGELSHIIMAAGLVKMPLGGWLDIISGYVCLVANAFLMVVCGSIALNAKLALSLVLALGPLFIAALAFPITSKFFDAWMSKVLNYVLLTIILALAVAASIFIADSYLTNAIKEAQSALDPVDRIQESFNFLILYIILCVFVWQSPHLAAALSGGTPLSGGGLGQFVMGALTRGQKGGGGSSSAKQLNSIEKNAGNGGGSSSGGGAYGVGRAIGSVVPAYKRAAQRRLGARK